MTSSEQPVWEDTVDHKLNVIEMALTENVHVKLERIENHLIETQARLMALEHSHARLIELFEKLWEGFQLFKDSPMLRMFAGGIMGGKKNATTQGKLQSGSQPQHQS